MNQQIHKEKGEEQGVIVSSTPFINLQAINAAHLGNVFFSKLHNMAALIQTSSQPCGHPCPPNPHLCSLLGCLPSREQKWGLWEVSNNQDPTPEDPWILPSKWICFVWLWLMFLIWSLVFTKIVNKACVSYLSLSFQVFGMPFTKINCNIFW